MVTARPQSPAHRVRNVAGASDIWPRALSTSRGPCNTIRYANTNTVAGLATVFVLAYLMVLQGPRLVDSALGQMSEAPATLRTRCAGDCGRAVTIYMTGNLLTVSSAG